MWIKDLQPKSPSATTKSGLRSFIESLIAVPEMSPTKAIMILVAGCASADDTTIEQINKNARHKGKQTE